MLPGSWLKVAGANASGSFSIRSFRRRQGRVRIQVAEDVLDAGQVVLQDRRVPVDFLPVPQRAVEGPALAVGTDPANRVWPCFLAIALVRVLHLVHVQREEKLALRGLCCFERE